MCTVLFNMIYSLEGLTIRHCVKKIIIIIIFVLRMDFNYSLLLLRTKQVPWSRNSQDALTML